MNVLGGIDFIFSGLHDISFISAYSLRNFVKTVFGLEEPVMLWRNEGLGPIDFIFSGLHDISFISSYSLTTFVKEVFWLEIPVKVWRNQHFSSIASR